MDTFNANVTYFLVLHPRHTVILVLWVAEPKAQLPKLLRSDEIFFRIPHGVVYEAQIVQARRMAGKYLGGRRKLFS